jgi:membrane protease YdiL (CAAX protease family)
MVMPTLPPDWMLITRVAEAAAMFFGYYLFGKKWIIAAGQRIADWIDAGGRLSRTDVSYVVELGCIALTHLGLVFLVASLIDYNLGRLFQTGSVVSSSITGVFLGFGEMGLSSFICRIAISALVELNFDGRHRSFEWWISGAKAGWFRHHLRTVKLLPAPFALTIVATQITAEELMFRGVLINLLLPLGLTAAALLSCLLFVVMQTFQMPSWHSAIFPVIGGLVMGPIHTALILKNSDIVPLIIAHLTFFAAVVL